MLMCDRIAVYCRCLCHRCCDGLDHRCIFPLCCSTVHIWYCAPRWGGVEVSTALFSDTNRLLYTKKVLFLAMQNVPGILRLTEGTSRDALKETGLFPLLVVHAVITWKLHAPTHMPTHTHARTNIYTHKCSNIHTHAQIYTHSHTNIYTHTHTHWTNISNTLLDRGKDCLCKDKLMCLHTPHDKYINTQNPPKVATVLFVINHTVHPYYKW